MSRLSKSIEFITDLGVCRNEGDKLPTITITSEHNNDISIIPMVAGNFRYLKLI
jgi:hypothetical protein